MSDGGPRFGIRAPAFPAEGGPVLLRAFAERSEARGLESFWMPDRIIPVGGYLSFAQEQPLLEPLTALAFVAAGTRRIRLGTGVVIAPLRHPLTLAKAAANVHYLSSGRLVLGLGTGWAPQEFAAMGVPRDERGSRTDEAIEVLRKAFTGDPFDHHGRHHDFVDVSIDPTWTPPPAIWGSGGTGADEYPLVGGRTLSRAVARRLARLDGWLTRPTTTVEQLVADREAVWREAESLGRDPSSIEVAHVNFCHLVDGDRASALAAQRVVFREVLGDGLSFERVQQLHWTGTLDDIAQRVGSILDVGVRHVVIHPLRPELEQIDLWVEGVLSRLGHPHKPMGPASSLTVGARRSVPPDPSTGLR